MRERKSHMNIFWQILVSTYNSSQFESSQHTIPSTESSNMHIYTSCIAVKESLNLVRQIHRELLKLRHTDVDFDRMFHLTSAPYRQRPTEWSCSLER